MYQNEGPNLGITPQARPESTNQGDRSSRLTGRLGSNAIRGSSASNQIPTVDYDYEEGDFEQKPKIVKDFAKAYMQVRILNFLI